MICLLDMPMINNDKSCVRVNLEFMSCQHDARTEYPKLTISTIGLDVTRVRVGIN